MPHQVRTLVPLVQLPGAGRIEASNTIVTLSDVDFSAIPAGAFGVDVTDLGAIAAVQGNFVANPAALTANATTAANAVAAAGANPTKAEYDAVVALVNELKSDHNALLADVTALRTTLDATLTSLKVNGGSMKSS